MKGEILTNPKARRDYHILETFEAGIVLHGTEVKALRAGKGQISDAFARVEEARSSSTTRTLTSIRTAICRTTSRRRRANCCCTSRKSGSCSAWRRSKAMRLLPLAFYWKNGR